MENQFRMFIRAAGGYPDSLAIPEVSDGFDETLPSLPFGLIPVSFCTGQVPMGIYKVSVRLEALEDVKRLYLFTGRKQLREILSMKCGQCLERVYYLSAAEVIPRFHEESYPVQRLFFTYCARRPGALRAEAGWEGPVMGIRRIFLCGDSTVTDHASELPYHPGACYAAWGQALPAFMEGRFAVENQAHCGLTTEAFRQEGHFGIVMRHIRKGDICLFQFGHNDQKLPHLLPNRGFPANLRNFAGEIREAGGCPVLVTPLGRNIWDREGRYLDFLAEYARVVGEVAEAEQIPWIDLHGFSVDFICRNKMERSRSYFHPGDYTHTNEYGACVFGAYVAKQLAELFPETLGARDGAGDFVPPDGLWETLGLGVRKNLAESQREQFDNMEKSTADLVRVIREAEEEGTALEKADGAGKRNMKPGGLPEKR